MRKGNRVMSRFGKYRGTLLRLMLLIGFVIVSAFPGWSWVSAQNDSPPPWVVRALHTSAFGVDNPSGLAFSPVANMFLILDGSANIAVVTIDEESAATRNIPDAQ